VTPFCRVKWTEAWYENGEFVVRGVHGVLMSEVVYDGGLSGRHRWLCIVATGTGNVEKNPLDLTVTGVWIPGEPLEPE